MRKIAMLLVGLLVTCSVAGAQEGAGITPEFRPIAGAYLPTGTQRDDFKDAMFAGLQVAFELPQNIHLLGSFGWSPSKDRLLTVKDRVDLYQYDVGAELFRPRPLGEDWSFRPFVGAGLGARTYHMRDLDMKAKTYMAGYGALGAEFQLDKVALRLEGRDYASSFKGLTGGQEATTRNDVALMAGFAYHLW